MKLVAVVVALIVNVANAAAQPAATDDRSPGTALALSALPTLGGAALMITAGVLADSEGCTYVLHQDDQTHTTTVVSETCTSYGAAVPVTAAVGVAAFLIGPTLGHAYAGRTWNKGLKVRLLGIGIAAIGGAIAAANDSCRAVFCANQLVGGAIAMVGGGTFAVGTAIEIATAPSAARATNHRASRTVDLVPLPMATGSGTAPGLLLSGCF